jgi:starch phosphorylase
MTDVDQTPSGMRADLNEHSRTGMGAPALQRAITDHIRYSIGRPAAALQPGRSHWPCVTACRTAGWRRRRPRWTSAAR